MKNKRKTGSRVSVNRWDLTVVTLNSVEKPAFKAEK